MSEVIEEQKMDLESHIAFIDQKFTKLSSGVRELYSTMMDTDLTDPDHVLNSLTKEQLDML